MVTGWNWKEKDLEDFLEINPGAAILPFGNNDHSWQYETIGRQVKCDNGIIDLLVRAWVDNGITVRNHIYVYELKKVEAKRQDREQVNRYVKSVKSAMHSVAQSGANFYRDLRIVNDFCDAWVTGILIAPSGAPDVFVTRWHDGFSFRRREGRKPAFDNSELESVLAQHVRQNIQLEAGVEWGEKITNAQKDLRVIPVWKS